MWDNLMHLMDTTGFALIDWRMFVMWAVVAVLLYLAVAKNFEPLLLVPIAFGALLANLPTNGITNKPAGALHAPVSGIVVEVADYCEVGTELKMPRVPETWGDEIVGDNQIRTNINAVTVSLNAAKKLRISQNLPIEEQRKIELIERSFELGQNGAPVLVVIQPLDKSGNPQTKLIDEIDSNGNNVFNADGSIKKKAVPVYKILTLEATSIISSVNVKVGDRVVEGQTLVETYSHHSGGLYYYISKGIQFEIFPPLIFLGVGALTDFGPLIANPRTLLLGAAAQAGIFLTFISAKLIGFSSQEAASIGIIGGADGPTSIFLTNKLAPHLLAPIAVSAYSYMALVPIIQPPVMRLLTTQKQRKIRMQSLRKVGRTEKLVFALVTMTFCILLVPDAAALLGMLFLGNFLRECAVVERISKTAQNEIINIITIFLGTSVGMTMTGERFLDVKTLGILALGVVAFIFSTATGVVMAHVMNLFSKNKINPLIGSAGVSAVPMAARVSQVEGQKADPTNFLLMHALGPNVAGVIGTAVVAGYFITTLAGK